MRKVESGHGLVDHGDPGSGLVVTRLDTPPAQEVRADRVEISGSHVVVLDGCIAVHSRGEPFDLDVGCRFGAAEDAVFGDAHRGDTWNCGGPGHEVADQGIHAGVRVSALLRRDVGEDELITCDPYIGVRQTFRAAYQHAGPDKQKHRERHLRNHQSLAEGDTSAACPFGAAVASLRAQCGRDIRTGGAKGRHESNEQRGRDGQAEGERDHRPIQPHIDGDGPRAASGESQDRGAPPTTRPRDRI